MPSILLAMLGVQVTVRVHLSVPFPAAAPRLAQKLDAISTRTGWRGFIECHPPDALYRSLQPYSIS